MEKTTEINGKIYGSKTELEQLHVSVMELKAETEKKFEVTAKLIESVMDAVEKISPARKCEADKKGIQLLKGELKQEAQPQRRGKS